LPINGLFRAVAVPTNYLSYISLLKDVQSTPDLSFWLNDTCRYPTLSILEQDLIAAPAPQAYSERVVSILGDLQTRKSN
jgi:hypothetical protein